MNTPARLLLTIALLYQSLASAAYITDKLYVGLYKNPESQGKPDKVLTSGTSIKLLEQKGTYFQVELEDGAKGWVERRYIIEQEPALLSLIAAKKEGERLRVELDQTRNELANVQKELSAKHPTTKGEQELKKQLDAAHQKVAALEAQQKQHPTAGKPAATGTAEGEPPASCEQQLDEMESKQLQCQVRLSKYTKDDKDSVNAENDKLRERMQQAISLLGLPPSGEVPTLVPLSELTAQVASQVQTAQQPQPQPSETQEPDTSLPVWVYVLMVLTLLTGIIAGFALFDYRSRYRYSIRL